MNRIAKFFAIAAVIASIGGHWAFLQGVAWTTMLARYSQSMPLPQAVAFTFDGEHPCKLCHAVQSGRQTEREQQERIPVQKFDFFLVAPVRFVFLEGAFTQPGTFVPQLPARADQPPLPPPRLV